MQIILEQFKQLQNKVDLKFQFLAWTIRIVSMPGLFSVMKNFGFVDCLNKINLGEILYIIQFVLGTNHQNHK